MKRSRAKAEVTTHAHIRYVAVRVEGSDRLVKNTMRAVAQVIADDVQEQLTQNKRPARRPVPEAKS